MVAVSCNPYEESKEHGRPQAAKKSPVGSFLVFGSQRLGMSNVVAVSCNPYEDRKSLWADKVTPKNTKGEPSNGRLAFLRIAQGRF